MKGKRMKKEKKTYKRFLIIYIIILTLLMSVFLTYVAVSLIQYENNQVDNYIENTIEQIKKACKKGKLDKYMDLSSIDKSEYERKKVTKEEGLRHLLENQNITYKNNTEDESKETYDIYANDRLILNIELNDDKIINRLGILSFNKLEVENITNKIEGGIYNYNILVPNSYKVYINNKELVKDYIKEKVQNEGMAQISRYVEIPYIVKYEVPNLLMTPEVKIVDENGKSVEYQVKDETISVNLGFKKIEEKEEALKQIKDAPNILKVAEDWSLFLTDDLSGTLNGYYNINKYLIKDSDISKFAYNWATGVDITFISRHTLEKPIFTNEKLQNFEIYNENAFSCEVYLEKNMRVLSKKLQDKMNERMYFVYDKDSSEWKLVNMQAIVEN